MGKDQESLGMPAVQTIHILTKKGEGGQIIWHLLCYIYILFEQKVFMYECHSSKMGIQNIYQDVTKERPFHWSAHLSQLWQCVHVRQREWKQDENKPLGLKW